MYIYIFIKHKWELQKSPHPRLFKMGSDIMSDSQVTVDIHRLWFFESKNGPMNDLRLPE